MPLRLALMLLALASCGRTGLEEGAAGSSDAQATGGRVGMGGTGGTGATGGIGPVGGAPGLDCGSARTVAGRLQEVERNLIAPRCGGRLCHGSGGVFPPRNLDNPALVRSALLGVKGALFCKQDEYVNRNNPAKSYLLATVMADGDRVTCPSGGQGGTRMPNRDGMPTVVGDKLTPDELACLEWYVQYLPSQKP